MRLGNICPDPRNARRLDITTENDPKLLELADSIKQFGDVIEPIVVRLRPEDSLQGDYYPECHYMLISGHRRLAAAKLAGLETIHCSMWENVSDNMAFEMQLTENLHRADLSYIEEAEAYKRMKEELGYNYGEIALRVGKSEKHIGRYIKLLTLPGKILQKIDKGDFTLSKALFLCSLNEKIIEDVVKYRDYLLSSHYKMEDFRKSMLRTFIVELEGTHIKFNPKEKYTDADGAEWPACTRCPHKKQMNLFEEFDKDGQCPYAPCFETKEEIVEQQHGEEQEGEEEDSEREEEQEEERERIKQERAAALLEEKIKEAVDREKICYYIEQKIAKGFSVDDISEWLNKTLELDDSEDYDHDFDTDDIFLKHLGKSKAFIKESNDYELFVKALVIDRVIDYVVDFYKGEEHLVELIECEQCPDERLENARKRAMGIGKS
jgi:ParB/RepB/Spo0J family partition protein